MINKILFHSNAWKIFLVIMILYVMDVTLLPFGAGILYFLGFSSWIYLLGTRFALILDVVLIIAVGFVARSIKLLEGKKSPAISDGIGTFIMMLGLPIGIWFLQPTLQLIGIKYFPE